MATVGKREKIYCNSFAQPPWHLKSNSGSTTVLKTSGTKDLEVLKKRWDIYLRFYDVADTFISFYTKEVMILSLKNTLKMGRLRTAKWIWLIVQITNRRDHFDSICYGGLHRIHIQNDLTSLDVLKFELDRGNLTKR